MMKYQKISNSDYEFFINKLSNEDNDKFEVIAEYMSRDIFQ